MSDTSSGQWFRRVVSSRRRVVAGLAATVLVVLVIVLAVVLGGDDGNAGDDRQAGEPTSAPTSAAPTSGTDAATPAPEAQSPVAGSVDDLPPSLPQVGLTETAAVGDGVTVTVASVERFQGSAVGPGNVAGPAVRVKLRLTNGTADDVSLGGAAVNAGYGPEVTPAPDLQDLSRAPFSGSVAAGETAEGTYVFSVPASPLTPLVIEVGYRPGAPLVLFVGPFD
jgi:hypothetical protein